MKEGNHANLAYEDHRRKRICEQLCDNTFEWMQQAYPVVALN